MRVDLHNHTFLCNHATGSMEEYVKKAIDNKTEFFGFSDHAPMEFDPKYRMKKEEMDIYEKNIDDLIIKYNNKITILKGYEVDYIPGYIDDDVLKRDVDYFIGSVHFLDNWGFDNPEFIGGYKDRDINVIWIKYFEAVEEMAESGLFDIVGHIDLIKVFNFLPDIDMKKYYIKTLEAIKSSEMAIEINPAGLRKKVKEQYPSNTILQLASDMNIPITFGSDAHKPEDVGWKYDEMKKFALSIGFTHCATFIKREKKLIKF